MKLGLNHISASGHIEFGKYGGPIERLLRLNEFRMFFSTCMPNIMLVDKSVQSSPLEPGLYIIFLDMIYLVYKVNVALLPARSYSL